MGILCVACGTRMWSDTPSPHKLIGNSPANEHSLFTYRICGHKEISVMTFLQ
jgi:hypothetical protein